MSWEPSTAYLIGVVLVSAAITWTLRAAPFALLAPLRESALMPFLNRHLPAGMMAILVIYTLASAAATTSGMRPIAALAIATATTTGLHLWRSSFVLSVLGGTLVHVLLASTVLSQ